MKIPNSFNYYSPFIKYVIQFCPNLGFLALRGLLVLQQVRLVLLLLGCHLILGLLVHRDLQADLLLRLLLEILKGLSPLHLLGIQLSQEVQENHLVLVLTQCQGDQGFLKII